MENFDQGTKQIWHFWHLNLNIKRKIQTPYWATCFFDGWFGGWEKVLYFSLYEVSVLLSGWFRVVWHVLTGIILYFLEHSRANLHCHVNRIGLDHPLLLFLLFIFQLVSIFSCSMMLFGLRSFRLKSSYLTWNYHKAENSRANLHFYVNRIGLDHPSLFFLLFIFELK